MGKIKIIWISELLECRTKGKEFATKFGRSWTWCERIRDLNWYKMTRCAQGGSLWNCSTKHFRTVATLNHGYNHFRENKKPKTISSRLSKSAELGERFFLLHEPQGKWSLPVLMNHRKSNMRSLYDVISLEFSFCDSVLHAVHYGSFQFTEKSRNKNFTIFQKTQKR